MDIELSVDVFDVGVYRVFRQEQLVAYIGRGTSFHQERKYFGLSSGQSSLAREIFGLIRRSAVFAIWCGVMRFGLCGLLGGTRFLGIGAMRRISADMLQGVRRRSPLTCRK